MKRRRAQTLYVITSSSSPFSCQISIELHHIYSHIIDVLARLQPHPLQISPVELLTAYRNVVQHGEGEAQYEEEKREPYRPFFEFSYPFLISHEF